LRFRLREAPRPFELERLLSLGALVEESLSTRLDSVRAPDRLCVEEDLLEPDARLRELPLERPFDEDDRLFDFDELRELPEPLLLEPLLLDRDFCCGILPLLLRIVRYVFGGYPNPTVQTRKIPTVQSRHPNRSSNTEHSG
jgi:hypothetical protein